jgi:tryptophan synthase alpha chain
MGRIDDIFNALRASGKRALMPFLVGGHPARGDMARLIPALESAGASIVEVGVPFSDPIADGPVIAAAMHQALAAGATPASVFDEIAQVRPRASAGLVAMVSVSIVHRMGGSHAFASRAAAAGFDGFIVPDAPLEESAPLRDAARDLGLAASLMIAPTTPPARAAEIARASTGFVYLLARSGITGEKGEMADIAPRVRVIREATDLPIACGFGISTREHVKAVCAHADAAIVGSGLVRRISEAAKAGRDPVVDAKVFIGQLASGLPTASPART